MRAEDVPGEWVAKALATYHQTEGSDYEAFAAALAAVYPLIARAERERCLTAVCTRQPLGPTIDRAETLAAIRALGDGEAGG